MKNKVALLIKPEKFEIETHKIDKLEKDYVLVKIHKTGVCGSDLHYFRHGGLGSFKSKMPLSLGHEASGIIVDKNNTNLKNNLKVIIDPLNHSCCPNSKKNNPHICEIWKDKVNICNNGTYLGTYPTPGTFREYIPLHKSQLTICNDNKVFDYSHLFEPLGIAMYAVNQAKINYSRENNVLIFGSGTIGLMIAEVLKSQGFKKITILDELNYRLKFAKEKIKINTLNTNNKFLEKKFTSTFDVIFDTITNVWSFKISPILLNNLGKMVIVGIPTVDYLPINPHKFRIKEIELINVRRSNIKMLSVLEFFYENKLNLKKYETHKYKLTEIQKAFNLSSNYDGKVIRCSVE